MKKFVVFTAIIGTYETIQQPMVIDERFDYILFSNYLKDKQIGVWQIRKVPYRNVDNIRVARWVKTHPELLLSDYKASLWIDGNIQIRHMEVYERFLILYSRKTLISCMCHNDRDCIFQEAAACVLWRLEKEYVVISWLHYLFRKHYPQNNGLFETGVLFRRHTDSRVFDFDALWWICINKFSKRDQLSFNYVLWEQHLSCDFFLQKGENVRNSKYFFYINHDNSKNDNVKRVTFNRNDDVFIYYYDKCYVNIKISNLERWYRFISCFIFPHQLAYVVGFFYRIKCRCKNIV